MNIYIIIGFYIFGIASGQQAPQPDDCLTKCLNNLYQNSKGGAGDATGLLDMQKVQVGNVTAVCPHLNDTSSIDKGCGPFKDLFKCADPCPDTDIKKLVLGAFRPAKFMCIDRYDDIKKNMPCMSDSCPDIQRACVPKCGSVEATTDRAAGLLKRVQGVPATNPPGQNNSTSPPAKDVDMSTIKQMVGDTCATITCYMACSEAPVTKDCGKDAYILSRDMVWTLFSTLAQSMSSLGISQQLPDQCQPIVVAGGAPTTGSSTTIMSSTFLILASISIVLFRKI